MTLNVADRTRVVDESTALRGRSGTVMAINGDYYDVRVDGFGANQTQPFLIEQLGEETRPSPIDYSH